MLDFIYLDDDKFYFLTHRLSRELQWRINQFNVPITITYSHSNSLTRAWL